MEVERMRILYIFSHPDDESFGPAAVMHQQIQAGHEVHLLTLTKGEATKVRFKLGLTVEEMGQVRYEEMLKVQDVLGLHSMEVLNYPDSKLQDLDPHEIEHTIKQHIESIQPDIVVSYPVHGVSGFHDHLVTYSVVLRAYLQLKSDGVNYLRRLAFFTLPDNGQSVFQSNMFRMKQSDSERIDAVIPLREEDIEMFKQCLACYETYKDTIEQSGVVEKVGNTLYFEFYGEQFVIPVDDITVQLQGY